MTPFYSDDWLTLYGGDVREVLPELASDSVDCIVTSPPYWGLRDYGTASWSGGDADCDHKAGRFERPGLSAKQASNSGSAGDEARQDCPRCGAVRQDSQLGLERTPEEYVANMVAVFRELRRVLKPTGTAWLNLGDSYAGSWGSQGHRETPAGMQGNSIRNHPKRASLTGKITEAGLKPKDLVGIPWRVAFALQADGWYLRSDIIWSKPNPMPESVTDRPTKSHEYLFLLTKSARYYFDADAVREQAVGMNSHDLTGSGYSAPGQFPQSGNRAPAGTYEADAYGENPHSARRGPKHNFGVVAARNIRSVWTIATRPYPGAHFAVFPPELPERCIKAGSSEKGVCPECGAPWERVVEASKRGSFHDHSKDAEQGNSQDGRSRKQAYLATLGDRVTTGWSATCWHKPTRDELAEVGMAVGFDGPMPTYDPAPAVILDPFAGSGTVGMVANRLSRRAILIDLNPEYLKQQMTRNAQTPLGLTEGDAA